MKAEEFPLGRGVWPTVVITYSLGGLVSLMLAIDVLTTSDHGAATISTIWLVAVLVSGWHLLIRSPRRIEVLPEGLFFLAPGRSVLIRWSELQSVRSPRYDLNRLVLIWRWNYQKRLTTFGPYGHDLERLLALLCDRVPHVDVHSAATRNPSWPFSPKRR